GPTGSNEIYYNSFYVEKNGSSNYSKYCLYINSTGTPAYIKYNVFGISMTGSGASDNAYGIFRNNGAIPTNWISDYNDLYRYTTTRTYTGYYTTAQATLANWQGVAGTPDLNSISFDPQYKNTVTGVEDFHINVTSSGIGLGQAIGYIDRDIDGNLRSTGMPDMGADELPGVGTAAITSGTYEVNGGANNYPTPSQAVADLIKRGVSGAVTINVYDDISGGVFVGSLQIRNVAGASAANPVIIQPAPNETIHIKPNTANGYTIYNKNGNYVKIKGFIVNDPAQGGQGVSDTVRLENVTGAILEANTIYGSNNTSYTIGLFTTGTGTNTQCDIYANDIRAATSSPATMYLSSTSSSNTIRANRIQAAENSANTSSGIWFNGADSNRIYNNFIYSIASNNFSMGIQIDNTATGNEIYYNSFYFEKNGASLRNKSCIYHNQASGTPANVFRYNIFGISSASLGNSFGAYGIYNNSGTSGWANQWVSDNNDLWRAVTTSTYTGYYSAAVQATLANWQSGSGQDINSFANDPLFTDVTITPADLHVADNSPVIQSALPVNYTNKDIDGEDRHDGVINSCIGADEKAHITGSELSGLKKVGGNPTDYATLKDALDDLHRKGINGAVTLSVEASQTGMLTIGRIEGISATNSVLIEATGDYELNPNANGPNVLRLLNAQYVTIKGFGIARTTQPVNDSVVISEGASNNVIIACGVYSANGYAGILVRDSATTNNIISANSIRSSDASGTTRAGQAITLLGDTGTKIYNNMIYTTTSAPTERVHVINIGTGTSNAEIYYNSIYMDNGGSTSFWKSIVYGRTVTLPTSAVTTGANNQFKYNIIGIRATAGTTYGCVFDGSANVAGAAYISNYNDLWRSVGGGTENTGWNGGAQLTLASWQSATGQDISSVNIDPQFTSASTGNMHIASTANIIFGSPVSYMGQKDYDVEARDGVNWDIGADERVLVSSTPMISSYDVGGGNNDYPFNGGLGIRDAVIDLNKRGVSGAVTINVYGGTYTATLRLGVINGASNSNRVLIQAASGQYVAILPSASAENSVIMNSTDYVTIKGIKLGVASQDSIKLYNGATNNIITGCHTYSANGYAGILVTDSGTNSNVIAANDIYVAGGVGAFPSGGKGVFLTNSSSATRIYNNMIWRTSGVPSLAGPSDGIALNNNTANNEIYYNSFYIESINLTTTAVGYALNSIRLTNTGGNVGTGNYIKYNVFGFKSQDDNIDNAGDAYTSAILAEGGTAGVHWIS
ncbi:hypothetical protein HY605_02575, partial [Candidatus Peregrinibacteria bacterium]|nr:hypothetical protein [Candidatus Peregrinibacteria bacterium]